MHPWCSHWAAFGDLRNLQSPSSCYRWLTIVTHTLKVYHIRSDPTIPWKYLSPWPKVSRNRSNNTTPWIRQKCPFIQNWTGQKNITQKCLETGETTKFLQWQVLFWKKIKTDIGFWSFSFLLGKDRSQRDKLILGGCMEEGWNHRIRKADWAECESEN